jgi:tRNA pseudouridine synthase 10
MEPIARSAADAFARTVVEFRDQYEFHTFWLGTTVPGPIAPDDAIAFRREINQTVGLRVLELAPDLTATPEKPEARLTLCHPSGEVTIRVKPLLIYGRYRKLSREIPQSKWPCRRCRGQGCDQCHGTGKRYTRTVEELIAAPLLPLTAATGTKIHCVGREDVDARMLGRGRPFVLELADPRVRSLELAPIEEAINRACQAEVEIQEFQFAGEALRRAVNSINPDKSYRAAVTCLAPASRDAVRGLSALRDTVIEQETPRRVLHRRPNRLRKRTVRTCDLELPRDDAEVRDFILTLRTESGTYIKEFISGDEGRTHPSVAQILAVPCECAELDVLEVHCDPVASLVSHEGHEENTTGP